MIQGRIEGGWEPVWAAFEQALAIDEAGGALSIVRNGEIVVDLWGGTDPLSGRAWDEDSVTLAFSVTKGIAALLVAMEVEANRLDPDVPVARYWPEFGAAGKADITVCQVLTHTAGLPELPLGTIADLTDQDLLAARLAAQPATYPPGSARIYHILSYGTMVGELLRRVTGRGFNDLVAERLAAPLGAALWCGQPAAVEERYRPGLMGPAERPPRPDADAGDACWSGYRAADQLVDLMTRTTGKQGSEPFNSPTFRAGVLPAGGLVCDARSLARVYGACVGTVDGVRLLGAAAATDAARDVLGGIREPSCLPDAVPTTRWGLGFEISHVHCPMLGEGSFGHAGMGGRLAFAHRPSGIGFGFVSQRMLFPTPGQDPRWLVILDAVRSVIG